MGKVLEQLKLEALFPHGPRKYRDLRQQKAGQRKRAWLEKRKPAAPEPAEPVAASPRYELPTCFICGKHGTSEHHTCGAGAGPAHESCGAMIFEAFRRCPRGCKPEFPGAHSMTYKRGDLTKIACKKCGAVVDLMRRIRKYVTEGVPD